MHGRRIVLLALSWCLLLAAQGQADEPKNLFPDKNLEAAVRKYVFEKRDNEEPLTEDDVRDISTIEHKGLKLKDEQKIKDLSGLEYCKSLALLDLEGHEISDVSPLKGLERLQSLNLAGNNIKDIAPLASVPALQYLQLEDNQVEDISPVAGLERLNSLYLSRNRVQDISPVAGLDKLWSLYLEGNQVTDIGPVHDLKWLSSLDLKENQIEDIRPLGELTELSFLFLEQNRVSDLSTLVTMARRDAAGPTRFAPFWRVYLTGNPLSEEARTKQIEELRKLGGRITFE